MNFKRSFYKQIVKSQHLLTICKVYKRILQKNKHIILYIQLYQGCAAKKHNTKALPKKGKGFCVVTGK